jgi:SAM-dependent methyltransferase
MSSRSPYTSQYFFERKDSSQASADVVAPLLIDLVRPDSVVDVGCGVGTWLRAFSSRGIEDVLGIDGAYIRPADFLLPQEKFISYDLSRPISVGRRFGLALCLEVAEHLPEGSAVGLVASLSNLSDFVYFSAAIPYQGGVGHLNERWPDYWVAKFSAAGFDYVDCVRPRVWNNPSVERWYAQNGLLFVRGSALASDPRLRNLKAETAAIPLALVHPRTLVSRYNPREMSVSEMLHGVGALLRATLRRTGRDRNL